MTIQKPKVLCVVGPTAAGKTELAVLLAKRYGGEVVSADSMQIYRGMDIGTAKPTIEERGGIPHHMLDVCDPADGYSVSRYVEDASECIEDIAHRKRLPILAGGTGLYIGALVDGLTFAGGGEDAEYRAELAAFAESRGAESLHRLLQEIDPDTASRLHPNDRKRVIRALELYRQTGIRMSEHIESTRQAEPRYETFFIGITRRDRAELYARIDRRVDRMLQSGLEDEVRKLASLPGVRVSTAMQAIGYKEMLLYIDDRITREEAAGIIRRETRRYAKRQLTWFRRDDRIRWIEAEPGSTAQQYEAESFGLADAFYQETNSRNRRKRRDICSTGKSEPAE